MQDTIIYERVFKLGKEENSTVILIDLQCYFLFTILHSAYVCHRCCIWETDTSMQSMHFNLPVLLTFTNCLDCICTVHTIMSAESFDWNTGLNSVEVIHDLMILSLFTAHYYSKINIIANKTVVTEFRFITNINRILKKHFCLNIMWGSVL